MIYERQEYASSNLYFQVAFMEEKTLKLRRTMLLLLLLVIILTTSSLAHNHNEHPQTIQPTTSEWAHSEVERAIELGLVPISELSPAYEMPVSLKECMTLIQSYIALQNHSDLNSFTGMISLYMSNKDEVEATKHMPLNDGPSLAYVDYLNLFDDMVLDNFDPNTIMTRQEVVEMLSRAYALCGGTCDGKATNNFRDQDAIAPWASKSVSTFSNWNIINGINGNFEPTSLCSIEQCIVLLLRLYEYAPITRNNGNVVPLFTYDDSLAYVESLLVQTNDTAGFRKSLQIDGSNATFVRLDTGGVTIRNSIFFMIHRNGGVKRVDLGICNTPHGIANHNLILENPHFSNDGAFFCCTVTLDENVFSSFNGTLLHEKGVYDISINVNDPNPGMIKKQ